LRPSRVIAACGTLTKNKRSAADIGNDGNLQDACLALAYETMSHEPLLHEAGGATSSAAVVDIGSRPGLARRVGGRLLREVREAVLATLYFFIGFHLIVLTTNLLVAEYLVAVSNFMLVTIGALVVGKAVLVANKLPLIRHYDRYPMIWPILFKTGIYWVVVCLVRLLERLVDFSVVGRSPLSEFPSYLIATFSWHRFVAISIWILVLFLIYVTATEFSHLFGSGEISRLLFRRRPSELQLNRRQRIRELLNLSRLADDHSFDELRDPTSVAHQQVIDILRLLAR